MAPVDVQVYQFFVMVLAGVIIGLIYDVYRTFRLMTNPGQWATAIYDTLFWLVTTALVLVAVFYASWGEVRAYVFVGMVTGGAIYFKLASPLVLKIMRAIWRLFARIFRFLAWVFYCAVVLPLSFAVKVVARILVILTLPFIAMGHLARYVAASVRERFRNPPEDPPADPHTD